MYFKQYSMSIINTFFLILTQTVRIFLPLVSKENGREEGWGELERERERNINVTEAHELVASHTCPHQSRDWTCNPGTGSGLELNLQPSCSG